MVVKNPEFGETDPVGLNYRLCSADRLQASYIRAAGSGSIESIAYPVDGDMLARERCRECYTSTDWQGIDTTLPVSEIVSRAQALLDIERDARELLSDLTGPCRGTRGCWLVIDGQVTGYAPWRPLPAKLSNAEVMHALAYTLTVKYRLAYSYRRDAA